MSNKNISINIIYIKTYKGDNIMNILVIFSLIFATIIWSILINRLVHCPILVGFAFFSLFLVGATIIANTTFVIAAILLGVLAFISAFIDCLCMNCTFLRKTNCLSCNTCNCNEDDNLSLIDCGTVINNLANANTTNTSNGCCMKTCRRR